MSLLGALSTRSVRSKKILPFDRSGFTKGTVLGTPTQYLELPIHQGTLRTSNEQQQERSNNLTGFLNSAGKGDFFYSLSFSRHSLSRSLEPKWQWLDNSRISKVFSDSEQFLERLLELMATPRTRNLFPN